MRYADYRRFLPLRKPNGRIVGYTLVDRADYERLRKGLWRLTPKGYVQRCNGQMLHRELLGLVPGDGLECDHANRNPLDNRRSNLRIATHGQNSLNRGAFTGSSSRFRSVTWYEARKKWRARVGHEGKEHHLGYFEIELDAALAVDAFLQKIAPEVMRDPELSRALAKPGTIVLG